MKANFPGIELLETEPRFEGKRKIRGRVFTYSIKRRTSRCSRALTARKWTKTCDAVLLIKSFSSVLLAFTLPSPSSTLKRTRNDGETNSARFLGGKQAQDLRFAILYLLELNEEGRKAPSWQTKKCTLCYSSTVAIICQWIIWIKHM